MPKDGEANPEENEDDAAMQDDEEDAGDEGNKK